MRAKASEEFLVFRSNKPSRNCPRRLREARVNPAGRWSKGSAGASASGVSSGGIDKKPKSVSLKNRIRSVQHMLRKDLPSEVREAQEKKLEGLKKQQEIHTRLAVGKKIFLRDRKIKFFERIKVERRIRRPEKMQCTSSGQEQDVETIEHLSKLKEDLKYVRVRGSSSL